MYVDGKDMGYKAKAGWWNDPSDKDAFRIAELNNDYPYEYFSTDHVSETVVTAYCDSVVRAYELLSGAPLKTIVEFGAAGGWFTSEFFKRGYHIWGFDGAESGLAKCFDRKIFFADAQDFRKPMAEPYRKFDIALCTEVAGHIEPPFSAMLVSNLVKHSDVIWWSSEEVGVTKPHLHHPNEQPYQYWINIFEFYGYKAKKISDEIFYACEGRGRYIFYNSNTYDNANT